MSPGGSGRAGMKGEIGRPEVQGSENGSGGLNRRKMPVSLE